MSGAQNMGSDNQRFVMPDKIWVHNNNKEVVAFSYDTLPKAFFERGDVGVACSRMTKPEEQVIVIVQSAEVPARVFSLDNLSFSPPLLANIQQSKAGKSFTVMLK
jgi:hypothetical protein